MGDIDEILSGLFDPLVKTAGKTALVTATVVAAYVKAQGAVAGQSPTDAALHGMLPQALSRALVAMHGAQREAAARIDTACGIAELKQALRRPGLGKLDKLAMWNDIMLRTYAVVLVAPHVFAAVAVLVALRSTVAVLAHMRAHSCSSAAARPSLLGLLTGGRMSVAGLMAGRLGGLIGSSPFEVDDADEAARAISGRSPGSSLSHAALTAMVLDEIPSLLRHAEDIVAERLGVQPRSPATPVVNGSTAPPSAASATSSEQTGTSNGGAAPLGDVALTVPIASIEALLWECHESFAAHGLDWQTAFARAARAAPRTPSTSSGGEEPASEPEDYPNGHASLSRAGTESPEAIGPSSPFAADDPAANAFRSAALEIMRDLLAAPEVDELCRGIGGEAFQHWYDVLLFYIDVPPPLSDTNGGTAAPCEPVVGAPLDAGTEQRVAVQERQARIAAACSTYKPDANTVTLLQFVVSADRARQQLVDAAALGGPAGHGAPIIAIPVPVRAFCTELLRASGPLQ